MKKQFLILLSLATISACSSNNKSANFAPVDDHSGSSQHAQNGSYQAGMGRDGSVSSSNLGSLQPGSQDELVATIGDRVFFGFNSATVMQSGQQTLERQAQWLTSHPSVTVTIEGHADERGTREYNLALGDKRANAVRDYLISLGVDANRIQTISYGKEHPEYIVSEEAAWSKNRRAVTVVN